MNEDYKLPAIVKAFAITIPSGAFAPTSGNFILGTLELKSNYLFSQRRTDINDLVLGITAGIREEVVQEERAKQNPGKVTYMPSARSTPSYPKIDVPGLTEGQKFAN